MKKDIAIFGGGCFWCTEAIFTMLRGVTSVTPGYAGGSMKNPSYYDVGTGETGHAEVIKIEFDPDVIPFKDLLEIFFHTHNPTTLNKQGNDWGTQYRSIILYTSNDQKTVAEEMIKQLNTSNEFDGKIVTEVAALTSFYDAEDYHKNFYQKNNDDAYCQVVIDPKLQKLREKYATKLKE